nr:mucin-4-like [Dermacentor andersoni]
MVMPILHAGQQNPIGQATAQSQMNLGGGNIVPQLPSGIGLLPGSSITTGTQVQSPQGSVNALVGHQTTATQSMTTTGAGIAGISITNGQQQSTGHAVSSINAVEPSANLSQHEGVGQATPPQTMLGSGTAGEQTAHGTGQQLGNVITTGSQVQGLSGNVSASVGHETTLSQSMPTTGPGMAINPITSGTGQQPGSPTTTGSQVQGLQGSVNASVGHQTTTVTSISATGPAIVTIPVTNGEQQTGGPITSTIHVIGQSANLNQSVTAGQATTLHTTVVSGMAVGQTTNGKQESGVSAVNDKQGSSQQSGLGTPVGQQKHRERLKIRTLKVQEPPKAHGIDEECKVIAPLATTEKCRRRRWFYDPKTEECRPSCSKTAPFSNQIACDGVCRSLEACDFPMASIPCLFRKVHRVYIYNQYTKKCFKGYDCGFFGNKFPTLQECQDTCRKYEGALIAYYMGVLWWFL